MIIYSNEEHIKNNCTGCKNFTSYKDFYFDDLEPEDQGFCAMDQNDNYGDAITTCNLFEKHG